MENSCYVWQVQVDVKIQFVDGFHLRSRHA
jgi:hypothetical protein